MTVRIANSGLPSDAAVDAPHLGIVFAVLNWFGGWTRSRRRGLLRLHGRCSLRATLADECESACCCDHSQISIMAHSFSPLPHYPFGFPGRDKSAAFMADR